MANHYEDTFPLEGDLETKRKYVIDSLNNLNWRYNSISKNEFEARLYVSMSSWGEKVNISFNEKSIYLRSKSIGITFADWGKNKNNVLKFMSELNSVIKNSLFVNEPPLKNIKQDPSEFSTSFIEKISNAFRLFENEVLSKEEFRTRKNNIINEFKKEKTNIQSEDFLLSILPLKDKGIIDDEDIKTLKSVLYKD